ncbi:phenylalanine--tRNA ligase beta subunit-related protein, partial [Bacillus paranthracis]|uniref:phenylalanine--tRNA ligase beta subunit-related protein n=1 Tax=Bacillus paranthracis TaxID=2026186 RepID=UPI003D656FCE
MKFSWKWLNQTIDLHKIPLHEVIHKLTLAGFEIEDIENKKQNNDKTLNISITTNRSDTLSIIGLANELSSLFNIHLDNKKKENHINTTKEYTQIEFVPNQIIDLQLSIINHINPVKSPKWLQEYLLGCDIIPKNSFIDVKEYINIKWGQAIEFLDAKKVSCGDLDKNLVKITNIDASLHYAEKMSNQFTYLEGLTYKNKVLSIFGLGPNPEISCYENTSSIIILGYICET